MIKCRIRVGFGAGLAGLKITGLFACTFDAANQALALYPAAQRVSVVVL